MATTTVTCGVGQDYTTLPSAISAITGGAGDIYRIELTDADLYKGGTEGDGNDGFNHSSLTPKLEIVGVGAGKWDGYTVGQGARIGGQYSAVFRVANSTTEFINLSIEQRKTTDSGICVGFHNDWNNNGTLTNVCVYHSGAVSGNTNQLAAILMYDGGGSPSCTMELTNCIFDNFRYNVENGWSDGANGTLDMRFVTATDTHGAFFVQFGSNNLTTTVRNYYVASPAGTCWNTHTNLIYGASSDYNASSDTTASARFTNAQNSIDPDDCYVTPGSDFTPEITSPLAGDGVAISGVTTDSRGFTRLDPPSIGTPDPTASGGPTDTPIDIFVTGTGTVSLSRVAAFSKALSASGTGSATLAKAAAFNRQIAASGTGAVTLAKAAGFARSILATGTGAVTLVKTSAFSRAITAAGTGSATLTRAFAAYRTIDAQGTGTVTLALSRAFQRTINALGTGVVTLTKHQAFNRFINAFGTGFVTLIKVDPGPPPEPSDDVGQFRRLMGRLGMRMLP